MSWAFTHTMFALYYAHDFYGQSGGNGGGLGLPSGFAICRFRHEAASRRRH